MFDLHEFEKKENKKEDFPNDDFILDICFVQILILFYMFSYLYQEHLLIYFDLFLLFSDFATCMKKIRKKTRNI